MATVRVHTLRRAEDVTQEIIDLTVSAVYGHRGRIDWEDVWDRVDGAPLDDGSVLDLGDSLVSPGLIALQKAVRKTMRE